MDKIEGLRLITMMRPDIGEHLMIIWGKAEFSGYVRETLAIQYPGKAGWSEAAHEAMQALRMLHRQEYPQFPDPDDAELEARLAGNASYQVVDRHFPHISRRLRATWGLPSCNSYLHELQNDTRDGLRHGFPPEVLFALFAIQEDHNREFPDQATKISDIWTVGGVG